MTDLLCDLVQLSNQKIQIQHTSSQDTLTIKLNSEASDKNTRENPGSTINSHEPLAGTTEKPGADI